MRKIIRIGCLGVLAIAIVATLAPGARASFPGQDTVAFVRYDGAEFRIFEMRPNGTEQHRIVGPETEIVLYGAAMSPDARWLVYSRSDGAQYDLFVRRIGGNTKRITDTPNRNEFSPMWTPDGESVVYMETDESTYAAIVLRDADGTHRREIDRSNNAYLLYPSVSPNGNRVLYSAPRGAPLERGEGDYELITRKLDGSGRSWLTDTAIDEIAGDWSPDGERVAYLVETATKPRALGSLGTTPSIARRGLELQPVYSIRSEGGGRRLISDKPGIVGRVLYTPNGERVMFARYTNDPSLDLFSTPVDGGVLKRLTETVETYNVFDLFRIVV